VLRLGVLLALVTGLLASAGATGLLTSPAAAAGVPALAAGSPVGGPLLDHVSAVSDLPIGVPAPPKLPAKGYLLADLTTGQILVARDVHRRMLPASTLKVLTALTLLPRLDQHAVYRARVADEDVDGSKVGIVAGSTYTVHQLFLGMMLSSGNDAANALAGANGGVPATVQEMQAEAIQLGALDTTVHDPSGLDAPGQRSSAYDLALFARAAMQRSDFRALVATRTAHFPGAIVKGKRGKGFEIQNHNRMLTDYPGAIGVKNGYTVHAKWTYIGAARRGGHTYLVTEVGLSEQGWRPAETMLTWAFAHGTQATPVGRLVEPGELAAAATAAAQAAAASSGPDDATALASTRTDGSGISPLQRWLGAAGLVAAAAILAILGMGALRRRRAP
jgi:D-alanyl-D-alanine carboxypeptidase (penicillin-binding protein 5/6)